MYPNYTMRKDNLKMAKVKFKKFNSHNVEIGQVRTNDRDELVMVIESENGIFGVDPDCFNVVHLSGEMTYRTLYENPVSFEFIIRDFPELLDVKEICITTFNKEVKEIE